MNRVLSHSAALLLGLSLGVSLTLGFIPLFVSELMLIDARKRPKYQRPRSKPTKR